jgi:hypothetical protein
VPDRRGTAAGARWQVHGGVRAGLLRRPRAESLLLVRAAVPPELLAFHLTGERLDVELRLGAVDDRRTLARLSVSSPLLVALRRTLPRQALDRLHGLVQTAAEL